MSRGSLKALVLFLVVAAVCLSKDAGTRWTAGRYGLPRSVLAPDGMHYQDGRLVDPYTQALVERDIEEEVLLAVLAIAALGLGWLMWMRARTGRRQREWATERARHFARLRGEIK